MTLLLLAPPLYTSDAHEGNFCHCNCKQSLSCTNLSLAMLQHELVPLELSLMEPRQGTWAVNDNRDCSYSCTPDSLFVTGVAGLCSCWGLSGGGGQLGPWL